MRRALTLRVRRLELMAGKARVGFAGVSSVPLIGGRVWYLSLWTAGPALYLGWIRH